MNDVHSKMDLILLSQEESLLKGLLLAELWHRFLMSINAKEELPQKVYSSVLRWNSNRSGS